MEKVLKEEVKTQVKLCVSKFTKFYRDKTAMVEIIKCITNEKTGEVIREDFIQNRIFTNKSGHKEYDKLIESIEELGEETYFKKLLDIVEKEMEK